MGDVGLAFIVAEDLKAVRPGLDIGSEGEGEEGREVEEAW